VSENHLITLRLPASLVERADALLEHLTESDETVFLGRPSRSIVLRLAVLRGLELLEQQVQGAQGARPAAVKRGTSKRRGAHG
jgi:hypothetical protein